MGIRSFFHKLEIGFIRLLTPSLPNNSEAKRYGEIGEDTLVRTLQLRLPACKIKQNILIQSAEGTAELDCLVLYQNKLFAIEVKRWKGDLYESESGFVQKKCDRWTGEIHCERHRSPFKQLSRGIYLLRKQNPHRAWVNPIVFFEDADRVSVGEGQVWFCKISHLLSYITEEGRTSDPREAARFFDCCVAADSLYANGGGCVRKGIVCEESLRFSTPAGVLTRREIRSISITHCWAYDELAILTADERLHRIIVENGSLLMEENGYVKSFPLCRVDKIRLGTP